MELKAVCPLGAGAARYLNDYEDLGGLSLALGRDAIASVQQIAIPLRKAHDTDWIRDAVVALDEAADGVAAPVDRSSRFERVPPSPQALVSRKFAECLADRLPVNLRRQFVSAATLSNGEEHVEWARRVSCLWSATENPADLLARLDSQELRQV